jgi:carboxyl-terminal processing protease
MKPLTRSIAAFTALGLSLITTSHLMSQRPMLRLDAPTEDGQITQLTTQLLEQGQFSHRRLDADMASKFLDEYLDTLDGSHEVFLQSDVAEFRQFLPNLARTLRNEGDDHPARVIFVRYLKRIEQRSTFVTDALKQDHFDFTGHGTYSFDREKAVRPLDMAAAHALWQQRLNADVLQEKLAGKKPDQFAQTLTHRYERQVKMMKKLSPNAVLESYLNALAHIYDPHSDYMGREQLQSFNTMMNLSLAGIGATLTGEDGMCKIRDLVPGGPAALSGKLKVGDRIVGVSQGDSKSKDDVDLQDMPLPQAVDLIRGPKGTDVTLTILPTGAGEDVRKLVTIRRDEIHLEAQRAKARIVELPVKPGATMRLGVIDLPGFYASSKGAGESATADVAKLLHKLKDEKVRGVILDLRRNGGGSLEEAISLTGLFISQGPVVQTRDLSGHVEVGYDEDETALYQGPLVILTSRFSASASEILAGALQDYGRAMIVGDSSTFGKGTVQTMLPLGSIMQREGITPATDPGALKLTISKFYRPDGSSTQLRGVRPDIVLPSFTDTPEVSESGMKYPLPWDAVPAAHHPQYDLVKPYIDKLSEKSQARIDTDRDFAWWLQDLARVQKQRTSKTLSMNEAERQKERDDAKARTKTRNAERLAMKSVAPTTYDITVKNSAVAGLPKPVDPAKKQAPASTADDEDEADAGPAQDILLRETQHILTDYVNLLEPASDKVVTKG